MSDLTESLAQVRSNYIQQDYVDRAKSLIAGKLQILDPTANIENTRYFNHSAIPDFVLSWPQERRTRDVFLRGSYASIVAAGDVEQLTDSDPIFLALDARQDFSDEQSPITSEAIKAESTLREFTLLTDVGAIGNLGEADNVDAGPLTHLVQANFVRGARGLVDDERATELVSTTRTDGHTSLSQVLRETFTADAFLRMERTAAIVDLALAEPDEQNIDLFETSARLTGRLSQVELESVLPWALRSSDVTRSAAFWRQLGALMTFQDLESIAPLLDDLDLSPLIRANVDVWKVQRAYVGLTDYDDPDRITRRWSFLNGALSVDSDYHRVSLASHGRSLRGRDSTALPRWTAVTTPLADFRLASVNLRGVTRSVKIDAEQSDDIRQDVAGVTESLNDDYHVSDIAVRFANADTRSGHSDVAVDFGKGLAVAQKEVTIDEMLRTALRVLAYRNPVSLDDISRMAGTEASAE
jgi:hypothetical protein